MSNFDELLQTAADDIPPAIPLPQGTYYVRAKAMKPREFTSGKGDQFLTLDLRLIIEGTAEDVDPTELETYKSTMGPLSSAQLTRSFMAQVEDGDLKAAWTSISRSVLRLAEQAGIDTAGKTIQDVLGDLEGVQFTARIEHRMTPDGTVRERVSQLTPVK